MKEGAAPCCIQPAVPVVSRSKEAPVKPLPVHNSMGHLIPGALYEPLIAVSNADGHPLNLAPLAHDRSIRLAVGAQMDTMDGTVNGLNQNSPHGETGEITLKMVFDGTDDGSFRGEGENDIEYTFRFENGSDALRVAFIIPGDVGTVDVYCCNDTGTQEICYDVDFHHVTDLIPNTAYCVTVIGALDEECELPPLAIGWHDKLGTLLDSVQAEGEFPQYCTFSDGEGDLRFAISGYGDRSFNGLLDDGEYEYFALRHELDDSPYFIPDFYRAGASTKDESADDVVRYPRSLWTSMMFRDYFGYPDRIAPEVAFAHGVCAGYCVKIQLGDHLDSPPNGPTTPTIMSPERADMNGDGTVNASDLALLLSFWGDMP